MLDRAIVVYPFRSDIAPAALREYIEQAIAGMLPFAVRLHEITGYANEYLFLNVKRGNDELIALHDRLYTGMLAPFLAPEFTFTPQNCTMRRPLQRAVG